MNKIKIFILMLLFVFSTNIFAAKKEGEQKVITFKADVGSYKEVKNQTIFVGQGNAFLEIDGNEIYCDEIEIFFVKGDKQDQVEKAVFHKNIRIFREEEEVQIGGESAEYFKAKKLFVIKENAFFTDAKNEAAVFGDTIYNYEKEQVTIIQGNTRVYQKDIFAKGAFVKYTKNDKLMSISGFPTVKNQGSEYNARKIIVDVENNTFLLKGDLQAEILNEEKKDKPTVENNKEENTKEENTTKVDFKTEEKENTSKKEVESEKTDTEKVKEE